MSSNATVYYYLLSEFEETSRFQKVLKKASIEDSIKVNKQTTKQTNHYDIRQTFFIYWEKSKRSSAIYCKNGAENISLKLQYKSPPFKTGRHCLTFMTKDIFANSFLPQATHSSILTLNFCKCTKMWNTILYEFCKKSFRLCLTKKKKKAF